MKILCELVTVIREQRVKRATGEPGRRTLCKDLKARRPACYLVREQFAVPDHEELVVPVRMNALHLLFDTLLPCVRGIFYTMGNLQAVSSCV